MTKFSDFAALDTYFYQMFDGSGSAFAQLRYKGREIGLALQHNVFEYFRTFVQAGNLPKNFTHRKIAMLRIMGTDHKMKLVLNRVAGSGVKADLKGRAVFFADNFVARILDDFIKVIAEMKPGEAAFCTTDARAFRYMKSRLKGGATPTILWKPVASARKDRDEWIKLEQTVQRQLVPWIKDTFGNEAGQVEKIVRSNLKILVRYFDLFEKHIKDGRPGNIVLGSDGFGVARALCFAAANSNVPTYVLQHGLLGSLNGFLPLIADNILLWSGTERDVFSRYGVASHRLLITGSPRFALLRAAPAKHTAGNRQLLFVLSPSDPQEVYSQMDTALEIRKKLPADYTIVLRPHPYFRLVAEAHFKTMASVPGLFLDNQEFLQSLNDASVVVFANISTGVYEAKAIGKDVFIAAVSDHDELDIYKLPRVPVAVLVLGLSENSGVLDQYNVGQMDIKHIGEELAPAARIANLLSERETAVQL